MTKSFASCAEAVGAPASMAATARETPAGHVFAIIVPLIR
jgi:hypothetical protein